MFYGTVPTACIEQVFRVVDFSDWRSAYVCCSGTFRIERALKANYPDLPVFGNDVSIFSTALGRLLCNETEDFEFIGDLAFIEPLVASENYDARVAALIVAGEMARYSRRKNPYARRHFDHYVAAFPMFLERARAKLNSVFGNYRLDGYFAGDWVQMVEKAIANGAGIAAFPPFFKGDYEAQFKFLHENTEWQSPSYELYDPATLPHIVDLIQMSGVPYVVLTDQTLDGRKPVVEFISGRKVPHFCYANTEKTSRRELYARPLPFKYDPVDVSKLKKDSKLTVCHADAGHLSYIKDVYLAKSIVHTTGMANYLIYADGMLIGGLVYALMKYPSYGPGAIYLLSDVTLSTEAKLSKLVAEIATSREVLDDVGRKCLDKFDYVVTTARTHKPVSMKYRSIYKLLSRKPSTVPGEGNILQYGSKSRAETPQQLYEKWYERYAVKA